MLLSSSPSITLGLALLAALCFAGWANTLKAIKKWRYELYNYDFAFGFAILVGVAAFVLGAYQPDELTFQDNFFLTGYRKMAYCLTAGFIFGCGNLLLTGAVSLSGMGVGVIISLGVALLINIIRGIAMTPGNFALDGTGALLVLVAVVVAAYSHSARNQNIVEAETNVALQPDPRWKQGERQAPKAGAFRGTLLAIVSGILLGLSRPVLDLGRFGDDGVSPYGAALLFAGGLIMATFFFSPFLCAFPVRGRTLRIRDYFKGGAANHVLGLVGGIIAGIGLLASFLVWSAPIPAKAAPASSYAIENAAAVIAGILGFVLWKEFEPALGRTRLLFFAALALLAAGVAVTAIGQV